MMLSDSRITMLRLAPSTEMLPHLRVPSSSVEGRWNQLCSVAQLVFSTALYMLSQTQAPGMVLFLNIEFSFNIEHRVLLLE